MKWQKIAENFYKTTTNNNQMGLLARFGCSCIGFDSPHLGKIKTLEKSRD